jgi:oligopeptide/dipeptide ABC transporter ATP-binding protein
LIGHDMGLQAQVVHRLAIMYGGHLMEMAPARDIFKAPRHPYTQALIASIPSPKSKKPPLSLPGLPPRLINPPAGCVFHPRCPKARPVCQQTAPVMRELAPGQLAACHLYDE